MRSGPVRFARWPRGILAKDRQLRVQRPSGVMIPSLPESEPLLRRSKPRGPRTKKREMRSCRTSLVARGARRRRRQRNSNPTPKWRRAPSGALEHFVARGRYARWSTLFSGTFGWHSWPDGPEPVVPWGARGGVHHCVTALLRTPPAGPPGFEAFRSGLAPFEPVRDHRRVSIRDGRGGPTSADSRAQTRPQLWRL